jgi:hypothetical protein
VLLAANVVKPRLRFLVGGLAGYIAAYWVLVVIVPAIFQKLVVEPSELALETPYLKNYIAFTRQAYDLNTIQETSYPALADLTPAVIQRNQDTIENIRLWDERPLLQKPRPFASTINSTTSGWTAITCKTAIIKSCSRHANFRKRYPTQHKPGSMKILSSRTATAW